MTNLIDMKNVSKAFGNTSALRNLSLQLVGGKFYALLGRNGVGKSTLLRILMRTENPECGEVFLFGKSVEEDIPSLNSDIGYVSESIDYVFPDRIQKFFKKISVVYPNWNHTTFDKILDYLKIKQDKFFNELSRGQKMQVAFGAAMAIQPKLMLIDEISAVLDAGARAFVMNTLGAFVKDGGTVLMATNIVSEVHNFADHVILLENGCVHLHMPIAELSKRFCKIRKIKTDLSTVFNDPNCVEVGLSSDGSISFLIDAELAKKYTLAPEIFDQRTVTAEDIFIYYTKGRVAA